MKRLFAMSVTWAVAACPVGVSAKDSIPANVTLRGNHVMDSVDWSFSPDKPIEFTRLKRCVAVTMKNDQIQLSDAAGSFVGPATGMYYQNHNYSTVAAQGVFKVIDEPGKFLVAQGWIDKPVFAFRWIIRYDLELGLESGRVTMVMRHIQLAMSNTGSSSNDGFGDLLTSYRFRQNYASLEDAARAMRSCIVQ